MPKQFQYVRPWTYEKQRQAIFSDARVSCIAASTKTGKTAGCIVWLLEQALSARHKGRHFWWIAPVSSQAKIAFERMKRGITSMGDDKLFDKNEVDKQIFLFNGSVIEFKSGDKPDSLYGEDVYAAVVDEASRMKEGSWHAIKSTLSATDGPVRVIGNVKGRGNWFYKLCEMANSGNYPGYEYHKLTAYDAVDAGIMSRAALEDAKATLPDHVFRELYLAEPGEDGGNPFGINSIESCMKPDLSRKGVVAWGWDLAKSQDYTVGIGLDEDGNVADFVRVQKSWRESIPLIVAKTKGKPALVDSTGVGDAILERLEDEGGPNFEGFKFTSGSKQQLMEGLSVAIQDGVVGYPDNEIADELRVFEYQESSSGQVRYAAPDGLHDDCVVSLALAWKHFKVALFRAEHAVLDLGAGRRVGAGEGGISMKAKIGADLNV